MSISILRSSNSPFLIFSRKRSRVRSFSSASVLGSFSDTSSVLETFGVPLLLTGGISAFRIMSSTMASAFSFTSAFFFVSTIATDCETRSRTMPSTSRPTYPTSVNLDASTFTKGASAILASLRAISVLPTPVAPIIKMLLGMISVFRSPSTFIRLQRLRKAIATFFFASF